jgi:hypothetical protein
MLFIYISTLVNYKLEEQMNGIDINFDVLIRKKWVEMMLQNVGANKSVTLFINDQSSQH